MAPTSGTVTRLSTIARRRSTPAFPIENPAQTCTGGTCVNNPKQPFSRQNYVGTLGGPIETNKIWFFTSFENVHENASIAYSPASTAQFDALAQLAADGLIDVNGTRFLRLRFRPVFDSVRRLSRLGALRLGRVFEIAVFLRTSQDSYLTHNALVQQATLPSTGLTTHNNYWNT